MDAKNTLTVITENKPLRSKSFAGKKLLLVFSLLIIFFDINSAKAATYLWTGSSGANWNVNGNWSGGTGYPGSVSGQTDAVVIASNVTINLPSGASMPGTISSITTTGTITISLARSLAVTSGFTIVSGSLTFSGASTASISSTSTINANSTFSINGPAITFNAGSTVNMNSNSTTFSVTSGSVNFAGTSGSGCTLSTGYQDAVNNAGTFTGSYLTLNSNNNQSPITNTGTLSISNGTFSNLQQDCYITSSNSATFTNCSFTLNNNNTYIRATAGNLTLTGCTVNSGTGSSNLVNTGTGTYTINGGSTITLNSSSDVLNSGTGTYTINGGSTVNISSFGGQVANTSTGTMNAGTSGSACTINISAQPSNTGSGASVYNTGTFNLGSTSVINFGGSYQQSINNTGTFTLKSDANGSAAISAMATGQQQVISGTYVVERFLTGGGLTANRGYRLMSSPVSLTAASYDNPTSTWKSTPTNTYSINYIKNNAYTGGAGGTGSGFTGTSTGPTLYLYKETLPASTSKSNFLAGKHVGISAVTSTTVTTTHNTDPTVTIGIPIGNGFLFYFVGPNSRGGGGTSYGAPTDVTLSNSGYINQGSIIVNLWYGATQKLSYGAASNPGYCMLGNPYPSTINLATVVSQNNSVIDNAYVLNSKTGGTSQDYVAYSSSGGTSSPLTPQYVVSGGGFIVHAKSASAFTFNESQKAPTIQLTGNSLIMSTPKSETMTVDGKLGGNNLTVAQQSLMALPPQTSSQQLTGLYMKMEKDTDIFSYCGIYYKSTYSAKFEDGDARYLSGPTAPVSISSLSADRVNASINNLPDYHTGSRVWLNINASTTGIYNLKLEGVRNIDTLYDIYLMDHLKKDSLDIRRYGTYVFNLNATDTSTFGANRFELVIRRKPLPQYLLTDFAGSKISEGVNLGWKTQNEGNYTGFTLEKLNKASSTYEAVYDKQGDGSAAYAYIDRVPSSGINTYRLKQNDIDGRISYSQPIDIFYDKLAGNGLINVFPNPTAQMINVSIPGTMASASYKLKVYNSSGNIVLQQTSSTQYWTQSVSHLQTGVYVVQVDKSDGTTLGKVKFVKQ